MPSFEGLTEIMNIIGIYNIYGFYKNKPQSIKITCLFLKSKHVMCDHLTLEMFFTQRLN
jgi:hypothetical protein